ncbi:hemolysin family protein [Paenibacillus sp. GCM10027626]|uniref:hemolysin family protein n=1 Tax=Paenibacillus sp. GCM10027626 TaxID=3273411 RepID=UPI003634911A
MLLVFLNGFFVSAEFAMVKVRSSRIDTLAMEGNRRARFAANVTNHLDAYLSACQLGITLSSLGLGWIGEPAIVKTIEPLLLKLGFNATLIHSIAFIIAFSIITLLHIVLGELAPKTIAIRKAESVTMWTALPLIAFHKVMYPFIWLLNGTANWILKKLFGIEPAAEHDSAHTEEEIRILMKESHKSGLIDNTELTLVDNIFEFAETNAREIMIPRTEMICLYADQPFEDNKAVALKELHTRFPLCDGDKDNIIGFVHIKDLLKASTQGVQDIRSMAWPITTVPESMQISSLLKLMQKKKTQIALLIDEYGGTSGMVTLEDIMEEIVGEIQDEFDKERPDIERRDDNTFSVNGMMLIEEVNSFFGLDISTDDYDTIGGWLYSQIEIPPSRNQRIVHPDGYEFIIEETDHLRISRIIVHKLSQSEQQAENLQQSELQVGAS